jgi:hypothetical protein
MEQPTSNERGRWTFEMNESSHDQDYPSITRQEIEKGQSQAFNQGALAVLGILTLIFAFILIAVLTR